MTKVPQEKQVATVEELQRGITELERDRDHLLAVIDIMEAVSGESAAQRVSVRADGTPSGGHHRASAQRQQGAGGAPGIPPASRDVLSLT